MPVKSVKKVVITGIGVLSSIGSGTTEFLKSIKDEKVNLSQRIFNMDKTTHSFHVHKVDSFNIADYGLDKGILQWVQDWKKGHMDLDLYYLAAVTKMALDDSSLTYEQDYNDIGMVVTHENPGLESFFDSS